MSMICLNTSFSKTVGSVFDQYMVTHSVSLPRVAVSAAISCPPTQNTRPRHKQFTSSLLRSFPRISKEPRAARKVTFGEDDILLRIPKPLPLDFEHLAVHALDVYRRLHNRVIFVSFVGFEILRQRRSACWRG